MTISEARPASESDTGAAPPVWLDHIATALHHALPSDTREDWTRRLYALLGARREREEELAVRRGRGITDLAVVHDWHVHTVLPLLAETVSATDPVPFAPLAALHADAATGRLSGPDAWRKALYPVLLHVHDAAYDRAIAYAEGHAGARDYALLHGRSPSEADAYGHEYAELSCAAGARVFAEAHALALGDALAHAYANDGCGAFADTFPGSYVHAVVRACGTAGPCGDRSTPAGHPVSRLSEGLLTALATGRASYGPAH